MTESASVLPALLTAGGSLIVAIISAYVAYRSQERSIKNQADLQRNQKDLKRLQAELDGRQSEHNARRDYEYEALKRLYQECSPLLFMLSEEANSAHSRIKGLAQSASQGKLEPGSDSWLTGDRFRYYRLSTEYRLFAPLATLRLLQYRLTQFDLSLEPEIQLIYTLARQAGRAMADDFDLAKLGNSPLAYDPHNLAADELRKTTPAVYLQQGVPRGILDNAAQALLIEKGSEPPRVMTFLEFEVARNDPDGSLGKAFKRIEYLFVDFHPKERPVMWRVLLASAQIYRAIGTVVDSASQGNQILNVKELLLLTTAEASSFDWRNDLAIDDSQAVEQTRSAVNEYLLRELETPIQRCLKAMHSKNAPAH